MKTRFRVSIYFDIFIKGDKTLEQARAEAEENARGVKAVLSSPEDIGYWRDLKDTNYSNPYIGGVAHYTPENGLTPLDREI